MAVKAEKKESDFEEIDENGNVITTDSGKTE